MQCIDQQDSAHEPYQMQNGTESAVSIIQKFETKDYHKFTVEGYQSFPDYGF